MSMIDKMSTGKCFRVNNTEVEIDYAGEQWVRLHGNYIAKVNNVRVQIFSCGWQTVTTKSRLNAILNKYCGVTIIQKAFQWYINSNGKLIEFKEGMEIMRLR